MLAFDRTAVPRTAYLSRLEPLAQSDVIAVESADLGRQS